MDEFVVVMIIVAVLLIIMVIASVCHNHYKIFSTLFRWIRKTHPELSKTASGHLIRVVQSSVLEEYKMSKTILGKGASGVCRVGTNIKSKKCFAIKIIELKDDNVKQFYKREIDILKDLEHLNIIRVFEAYEEVGSLGLVMELCDGGHLGEVIMDTPNGRLDEPHAQRYVCQLVGAIQHCHHHGICHRDIKLQNILLENRTSDAQIKLIDFGNAKRFAINKFKQKAPFKTIAGTTYCMAPEVFKKEYDERCDVWSLGVVAFIMLCGHKPFESINLPNHLDVAKSSLVSNIMMGRYSFQHPAWEFISEDAMMFIMSCFTMNYLKRPSAAQLFQDRWCSPHNISDQLSETKRKTMTRQLSRIPSQSLSQTSMIAVAFTMPTTEARDLRTLFQQIDKDGSGKVDREEFCTYMRIAEPKMSQQEANTLFDAIDQDGNQQLSFLEFVASMVDSRSVNVNEINQAFKLLDQEGKGYISHDDLFRLLAVNSNTIDNNNSNNNNNNNNSNSSSNSNNSNSTNNNSVNNHMNKKRSPRRAVIENAAAENASKMLLKPFSSFYRKPAEGSLDQTVSLFVSPSRRKSHENSIGDLIILQEVPEDMEHARLEKLQQKVKDIIGDADSDGDGRISYSEFLIAMTSPSQPIIPQAPSAASSPVPSRGRSPIPNPHHLSAGGDLSSIPPSTSWVGFENYDPKSLLMNSFSDDVPVTSYCQTPGPKNVDD